MEFGCHLPVFGPAATRAGLLTFAREMERLGYDSLWASDHIVIPHAISSRYPYSETGEFPLSADTTFLEPLTALAMVAGVTERARLGPTAIPCSRPRRSRRWTICRAGASSWAPASAGCGRRSSCWARRSTPGAPG